MTKRFLPMLSLLLTATLLTGCGGDARDAETSQEGDAALTGAVQIDGSSTVFPVSEAVAEEFQRAHPRARVTVGQSGTGGGFERFCAGETDVSDASREITAEEAAACAEAGIDFVELPVAVDGLSVVTHPSNDFVDCLTIEELRRVWQPDSGVETWRDIRSEWPAEEIELFGPGTDSGTFDYFTEAVVGEAKASRPDFQASEDDNILVQGVSGDDQSLGYFGYAYYAENQERLKLIAVDAGEGCVQPSDATIEAGEYPLARPLFIYVSLGSLDEPTVREFVAFYMESASELVPATGYHPLSGEEYQESLELLRRRGADGAPSGEAAGEDGVPGGAAADALDR